MKPLVSILIPAFNAERSIAETLESAVRQSWPVKEIIVVDDGSTDRTPEIVRSFAPRNVSLVRQENRGAAAARNRAFEESVGDYIQWLDADDLLSVDKIAHQMAVLERVEDPASTALSCEWGRFLSRPQKAEFVSTELWADMTPLEWTLRKLEHNLYMQTATWLVSRAVTAAAGPWNTQLLGDDDGEFFARVLMRVKTIKFVPEARVYYRMPNASSLSYIGTSIRKADAQFRSMQLTIDYVRQLDDSERTRRACVAYLQSWLVNFYPERPEIVEKASRIAVDLGGRLNAPRLSWKYVWVAWLLGMPAAKRAQIALTTLKWWMLRRWDRIAARVFAGKSSEPAYL